MEWLKKIPGSAWGTVIIALLALAFWPGEHETNQPLAAEQVEQAAAVRSNRILVHVSGAVVQPGMYQLPPDSRAQDAVAVAGGFLPTADTSRVNLAKRLKDGMQVRVPSLKAPVAEKHSTTRSGGTASDTAACGTPAASNAEKSVVAINHADEQALCGLPGVGPATARRIIAYRTAHGVFNSVDELLKVPGIGSHKLAEIRPLVTLE